MDRRPLGSTGLTVSPIGFGAFKIGRNVGVNYARDYELPDDDAAERLLNGVLDLGINLIDTAPAYGLSEERIGRFLERRRNEFILCTKAGEEFDAASGTSRFDFSRGGIEASVERSRFRLRSDVIDILLIHSDGRDREIIEQFGAVMALQSLRERGTVRAIGFSGKTAEGARLALAWAGVIMVEYHVNSRAAEGAIAEAASRGCGVLVKKALASGALPTHDAIPFVLSNPGVSAAVVGGLDLEHLRHNVEIAERYAKRIATGDPSTRASS